MPTVVHSDVFIQKFINNHPDHEYNYIITSTISATTKLLQEYNDRLSTSDTFMTWFQLASQKGKINVVSGKSNKYLDAPISIDQEYLKSSFEGGLTCILEQPLLPGDKEIFERYGVVDYSVKNVTSTFSDSPIEVLSYHSNDLMDINTMARYLKNESHLFIYDRFLNPHALQFIKKICEFLANGSTVFIAIGQDRINVQEGIIKRELESLPNIDKATIKKADRNCERTNHDRFMFIGKNYYMRGTAGFDSFRYEHGSWITRDCEFNVYYAPFCSKNISFSFVSGAAKICTIR